MAIDDPEVDRPAGAAAGTKDVEPRGAGEERRADRGRPQHVAAEGELVVPALDDGFGLGARSLVGGVADGAALMSSPRVRTPMAALTRPCEPSSRRRDASLMAPAVASRSRPHSAAAPS